MGNPCFLFLLFVVILLYFYQQMLKGVLGPSPVVLFAVRVVFIIQSSRVAHLYLLGQPFGSLNIQRSAHFAPLCALDGRRNRKARDLYWVLPSS